MPPRITAILLLAAALALPAELTYQKPPQEILDECRAKSIVTIGTATTPDEAAVLQDAGVNAIVASGEAQVTL